MDWRKLIFHQRGFGLFCHWRRKVHINILHISCLLF